MQPIRGNVLIKPFRTAETSKGGIFIPEMAMRIMNKGEVVAVGNGTKDMPMKLKQGDVVYRVRDWGQEVLVDGELHYIMDQKAVIAIE